jgi:hypothetical protein
MRMLVELGDNQIQALDELSKKQRWRMVKALFDTDSRITGSNRPRPARGA